MRLSLLRHPSLFALLALLTGAFLRFHQLGHVPPGLHYDFAANAILANGAASGSFREVFITAYTGKEVLFFYTAGFLFNLLGSSIFTLQLTAALYGVLGIAACYFAARQLVWAEADRTWVAALATIILSFLFMHLVWSRYGERATTEPFIQGLAIGFLFRGLRRAWAGPAKFIYLDFSLAGVFTGLAAYTYLAARLFPLPIAITLLAFGLGQLRARRRSLRSFFLYFIFFIFSAGLVFAPLGWFFSRHPETFLVRASQLIPKAGEAELLVKGLTGALGMIFIAGEPYDRFNIPGRPIFGPLLGLFFLIGLGVLIARIIRPIRNSPENERPAYPGWLTPLFTLSYTLTFLMPTALSVHDIFPSNVRSMGLLPVLTIFPAIGLVQTRHWVLALYNQRRQSQVSNLQSPITNYHLPVICAITLLAGTLTTYQSYFHQWAIAPGLYYANDTDLVKAARWINGQETQSASVYFSAIHYRHPTVAYLSPAFPSFRWFTGGQALALPAAPAIYIFPHAAPPPEDWIANWTPIAAPLGPDGTPDFRAYRFDSPPPQPNFLPASANFGNLVELTGYRLPEPGVVDVRLHVLNLPDKPDYRFVADLVDQAGYHWTQAFNDAYFSEQWQVGETILMRLKFKIEIGTPPGDYRLFTTLYSASANTTLPSLTAEGNAAAYAILGPIPISRTSPQPRVEPLVTVNGLNVIRLDPPPSTLRPGEPLPFTIHWQTQSPRAASNLQSLTVKLNDLVLESAAPVHNTYPATNWLPGEIVIDRHNPRLPRDLDPGLYTITLNDFLIGTLTVTALERQLTSPAPSHVLNVNYQSQFELVGYDLTPTALTLYWHTLKETNIDYTAFVHVLDATGQIVAQNDSQPRGGQYRTSLWAAGEYVVDTIQIPTAGSAIEIGWYIAETGERLKTESGAAVRLTP